VISGHAPPCQLLEWDSRHWRITTARVRDDFVTTGRVDEADEWCRAAGVGIAYLLCPIADVNTATSAIRLGFNLVDVRITLSAMVEPAPPPSTPTDRQIVVRDHEPRDTTALEHIARSAYRDSRFYSDGRFPRGRCDELYRKWIRQSCEGGADIVLVADDGAEPIGYVTGKLDEAGGVIELAGVAEARRGEGVGGALIAALMDRFRSTGAHTVTVATQGRNRASQRLHQRHGFLTDRIDLWLHKWYEASPVP
jgi:GNAT superfamily N-acetyltransferase